MCVCVHSDVAATHRQAADGGGAAVPGGAARGGGQALHHRVRGGGRAGAQVSASLFISIHVCPAVHLRVSFQFRLSVIIICQTRVRIC